MTLKRVLVAATVASLTALVTTLNAAAPEALPAEVQVGSAVIGDFEFDWGRDGLFCPTCNGGAGNARLVYADAAGNLWVGGVDFATGDFIPQDGRGSLVDTNVALPEQVGNGPEWMLSQRGSEIVYTRWTDGLPSTPPNQTLGFARWANGAWIAGPMAGSRFRQNAGGSLDPGDAVPRVNYTDGRVSALYWRDVSARPTETAIPIPNPQGSTLTRRWVPGTHDLIITGPALPDASGAVYRQVFLYHAATGALEQLTDDPVDKNFAFMWQAPEFGGANVFFTVAGGTVLRIYRSTPAAGGSTTWALVNSIAMPAATPYIGSPEPFVHNGRSWVFFWLSAKPSSSSSVSLIAMTGIDPAVPSLRALTSATSPARSRRDPEYFITANGPYIYYSRFLLPTSTRPLTSEGVFRVDTGLGPRAP